MAIASGGSHATATSLDEGQNLSVLYSFPKEIGLDDFGGSQGSAQHIYSVIVGLDAVTVVVRSSSLWLPSGMSGLGRGASALRGVEFRYWTHL